MNRIKCRAWDRPRNEMYFPTSLKTNIEPLGTEDIIMFFIGVKDIHGNDIYESDIVYDTIHKEHRLIVWLDYYMCFAGELINDTIKNDYLFYNAKDCKTLQIIGNVHENPKLFEELKLAK